MTGHTASFLVYNRQNVSPCQFSNHSKSSSHPEGWGSTFLQDMGIFNHYTVYRPKRRQSSKNLIVSDCVQIGKIYVEKRATISLAHVKYGCHWLIFVKKSCIFTCWTSVSRFDFREARSHTTSNVENPLWQILSKSNEKNVNMQSSLRQSVKCGLHCTDCLTAHNCSS